MKKLVILIFLIILHLFKLKTPLPWTGEVIESVFE